MSSPTQEMFVNEAHLPSFFLDASVLEVYRKPNLSLCKPTLIWNIIDMILEIYACSSKAY